MQLRTRYTLPEQRVRYAPLIVLFLLALGLRSYRLEWNPIWLDEAYGYQLGHQGIGGIIGNTLVNVHPPLYTILQWLASGLDTLHSEWGWRWPSVVLGAATVPVIYLLARTLTDVWSAVIAGFLAVLTPTHIFFSQESRPYALITFLAALTMLLLHLRLRYGNRSLWGIYTALCILGLWSNYSFALIVSVQVLYLAYSLRQWRSLLIHIGLLTLFFLPFLLIAVSPLSQELDNYRATQPLTLTHTIQAVLAGEPLRYKVFWAHTWLPLVFGGLALLGLPAAVRSWSSSPAAYHWLQVLLPPIGFFGIAVPLFGIMLPVFEAKQFVVLLPSVFVLLAVGIHRLRQIRPAWLHGLALLGICAVIIAGNLLALQRYWTITKSPEGLAVLALRERMQPDDAIVSLHYSVDAVLSFYLPQATVYTKPGRDGDTYRFSRSLSILIGDRQKITRPATVATIRQHRRFWLLRLEADDRPLIGDLTQGCTTSVAQRYDPFQLLLVECP
ncbi:MAG TPA: glycosyltransferase family 39 protein [Herpetosiphonaceae bacterium]